MIEVRDLTKWYGSTRAVDHVSFDVTQGEVLGFLGPNGAGKTTTMRILTCYIPANEGSAKVAGFDIGSQAVEVRRRIGYVPENTPLYLDLGTDEFLQFIARVHGFQGQQARDRISGVIDTCGLGDVLHKDVGALSKGFRQRLALAQALIHDPEVLILDEPTGGLDPNQIIEIRDLIKKLGREKTVILSTHILPEVEATCDRVQIIHNGRLVASGTPDELAESATGQTQIFVTLKVPPAEAEEGLRSLPGVVSIQLREEGSDRARYALGIGNGAGIEESIFRMAVDKGWTLTELHREGVSLEKIFMSLTTQERDVPASERGVEGR
jgi:ABC-2 type transport system ATP-binding protein